MPLSVSVVVPVRDNEEGIQACLDALFAQDYRKGPVEIIVVDNGSTDGTLAVVEALAQKRAGVLRCIAEAEKPGSYAARNAGIRASSGEVLAFTDSDCIPAPDWLRKGLLCLERCDAELAAGRVVIVPSGATANALEYLDMATKLNQKEYVEGAGFGATANLFVMRKVFEDVGTFRDDLKSGGDYEFGRRAGQQGHRIVYAQSAVVRHLARGTLKAKLEKTRRVAMGQARLQELGILEHGMLTLRRLVPMRRIPNVDGQKIGALTYLTALVYANFFRYYNLLIRLLARLR